MGKEQMVNARAKGLKGELEFCEWLKKNLSLDVKPKRNIEQVRSGGGDVVCIYPYCFEVKRVEKLDLFTAWSQCYFAAKEFDLIPIVAFRKNHRKWQFLIPAYFLLGGEEKGYLRLTEIVFTRWFYSHYQMYNNNETSRVNGTTNKSL